MPSVVETPRRGLCAAGRDAPDVGHDPALVADRLDDVAGAGLALGADLESGAAPAGQLGSPRLSSQSAARTMAAPSEIRRRASPRSRQPQTKGILKACLLMWCCVADRRIPWSEPLAAIRRLHRLTHLVVGVGQNLGLVNEVDTSLLDDLGLDKVADPDLRSGETSATSRLAKCEHDDAPWP